MHSLKDNELRNLQTFIKDISTKPPLLFPLVALFHVFALLYSIWDVHASPFPGTEWLSPLWMIALTACWVAMCDLRKWGAIGYIVLTVADLAIVFAMKPANTSFLNNTDPYSSSFFPLNVIFCFFVLFFYRRFAN